MWRPRDGIEKRAAKHYKVFCANDKTRLAKCHGNNTIKSSLCRKVVKALKLQHKSVKIYACIYTNSIVSWLNYYLAKNNNTISYNLYPDGAALLRPQANVHCRISLRLKWLSQWSNIPLPHQQNYQHGYSPFLDAIYHFPAQPIFADPHKLVIIPISESTAPANGKILIIGSLQGMSLTFVQTVKQQINGQAVYYRMHPRNHSGEQFIIKHAPNWQKLELDTTLEEHLLSNSYTQVIGAYSSAIVFNHLFVNNSQSRFFVDEDKNDSHYHAVAKACGIPVTVLSE